mgnify:CR=1 FL=1
MLKPISEDRPFTYYADLVDATGQPLKSGLGSEKWNGIKIRLQHSLEGTAKLEKQEKLSPPMVHEDALEQQLDIQKRLIRIGRFMGQVKIMSESFGLPFAVKELEFVKIISGDKYRHILNNSHMANYTTYNGILETNFTTDFEIEEDGKAIYFLTVRGHLLGKEEQLIQSNPQKIEFVPQEKIENSVKNRPQNFKITLPAEANVSLKIYDHDES